MAAKRLAETGKEKNSEGFKMLKPRDPSDRLKLKKRGKTEGIKMLRPRHSLSTAKASQSHGSQTGWNWKGEKKSETFKMLRPRQSKYNKTSSAFVVPESRWFVRPANMLWNGEHYQLRQKLTPQTWKTSKVSESAGGTSHFSSDPLHEDGGTSLWQTVYHSWTSRRRTNRFDSCVYPSSKAFIWNADDSYEAEEEAMLQGTLHVPVRSTSKDICSSAVVEIEQPTVWECIDQWLVQWCCRR